MSALRTIHDVPVLLCPEEGDPIRGEADATGLIGEAGYQGARWVALPAGRLDEEFFRLRTGVAGGIAQKFAQYRMGLAVLGDIARHTAASEALRDFVRECNRGRQLWFVDGLPELEERLRG
ncbi:DUF4180 domain-containing protein [Streptomyces sp. DSM 44917]|uniref:DUF4180 domain-containing protein n=1 Tax=Streptomyces boetiae TaxID=3075541 RepID=A0ABU2LFZ8_9ACTN|nr:DUF4180 domain-containing protein [Streptomyces sp. DSM 44917]MDT0310380.1 DUF4180 domain-containing protein [Streptomyces sp. DSM 44917]